MEKMITFFCDYRGTFVANDGILQLDEIKRFANNLDAISNRENTKILFSFVTMDRQSDIMDAYRLLEEQLTSNVEMGYQICSDGIFWRSKKVFSFSTNSKVDGMRVVLKKSFGKVYYFDDLRMNVVLTEHLFNILKLDYNVFLSDSNKGLASVNDSLRLVLDEGQINCVGDENGHRTNKKS